MTTIENVNNSKELVKKINSISYYSVEDFCKDAERYIKAIRETRMFCQIIGVSKSGMSRTICFKEFNIFDQGDNTKRGQIYNFYCFFESLGYRSSKDRDGFTISGCGMDMVFHTNYTIINRLHSLGFTTKDEYKTLSQRTPTIL